MVSPTAKRRAARDVVGSGLATVSEACRALSLSRSSYYDGDKGQDRRSPVQEQIVKLSEDHPRYGYRRVTALLRRQGMEINAKRVQRVRRVEGLQVKKKQRRMRRLGQSTGLRQRALQANQVWSWDFVEDQTENGTRFRILTLIDEYTREWLAVHVGWSIRAVEVIRIVEAAMARHGVPSHLRSDNGPEFVAKAVQDWLKGRGVRTIYIQPGSPWENGHIESFHDKLRDECLNREVFGSLQEAKVVIEQWREEYNSKRPHSSLGYQTPGEFGGRTTAAHGLRSGSALPPSTRSGSSRNIKPIAVFSY